MKSENRREASGGRFARRSGVRTRARSVPVRIALLLLAMAVPGFGQYAYYYSDSLGSNSSNWTLNGTGSFTSGSGFTSSGSSGLVSKVGLPPPGDSTYEVRMVLTLTQSGGTYSALLRASSNASLGTSSATGTFYAVEVGNVTFTNGVCSATLSAYKVISGTATSLASSNIPCQSGMVVRAAMLASGVISVYINNVQYIGVADSSITSGEPGISVASAPSTNTISYVQLGPRDTVVPNTINAQTVATSVFPTSINLQWQGVLDNTNGIGLWDYQIFRKDSAHPSFAWIGSSVTPDFTDPTVTAGVSYTYALDAYDYHWNASSVQITVVTPPTGNIDPREVGVRSLGSYWGDGSEQIDLRSGNLNYSIPLIKPMARGWSASFNLTYNSQNWRIDENATNTLWKLGDDVGYGFGWQLLAGSLTPLYDGAFTVYQYLFTDATGAQYHLNVNTSGIWSSKESIYVWYDSNAGRLYFRDGSFWVFGCTSAGTEQDAGTMYPTLMEDTNGNQITVTYQAGAGAAWTNSSARIVNVVDVRGGSGGNTYTFSYSNSHLSSITNSLQTAEAYTFSYFTSGTLIDPFISSSYGATTLLASLQQTPTGMTTAFDYDPFGNGQAYTSGEMTKMSTQYGGSLTWTYSTSSFYPNSRLLREVSSRQLVKQSGATATTYPITYGSNAMVVHASGMVQDPGGLGQKLWTFDTHSGDAQVGLATNYNARVQYGTNTGSQELDYTWTTNASGNLYVSKTVTTQDFALSSAVAKNTTQTQDQYGNVTQVQLSNWGQTSVVRTYTNTYLNSSNYTSLHIVNRLTGSAVTDGTNTSTLSAIAYDNDAINGQLAAAPGITAHDAAYACNYPASGCTTYYRGNPTTITQPGNTTSMAHDIAGNVVSSTTNGVTSTSTQTSPSYAVPSAITTGSFTTNLGFSSFLGLMNETGPNGDSLAIGYDTAARPTTSTSPYGAVTTYAYNDVIQPPSPNLPNHTTNTNNHGARTFYDGFARTIAVQTGTWNGSNFTAISEVDSVYGSCGCSPLGKLVQTSMPYTPASGMNTPPFTPASGVTIVYTTYAYDGMGRTLTKTAPDGSVTTYAYSGSMVTVTDPAGNWKQYTMDSLGNVTQVLEPDPSLGNVTTSYTYDVLNHLITVSMPRGSTTQTRTFNYTVSNSVGSLLLSATNPENGTVTYTYNSNNQIATKIDAKNQEIQYTYDSYNRVTEVQHFYYQSGSYVEDTSQRVSYTYDSGTYGQGRLTGITYLPMANSLVSSTLPTFSEAYTYTQPGSVASKQLSIAQSGYSGLSLTGSWTYNNEGKMTSVTYPSVSNHSGTYTTSYDGLARPSTLVDNSSNTWANGVSYGPSNELLSINSESRTYNSLLQLTLITAPGFSQQYVYPTNGTDNGKATYQYDLVSGEQVQYAYDSLNRLISAQTTPTSDQNHPSLEWGQNFSYDGFGNLYQKNVTQGSAPTLSVTVNAATNQISGYGYDSNGNTTYMPGSSPLYMGYDVENRMTSATEYSIPQELYAYDPGNRRAWKGAVNSSGVITAEEMYFYDPSGKKLGTYVAQFGSPGQWIATDLQVHFGKRRVAHWAGSTINTQVILVNTTLDRVGSVRNAGSQSSASAFYPYGEDKGMVAPNDQTKFATYTRDSATGLDYAMNRYYSNALGRFMTPDPYRATRKSVNNPGRPQSWNRYSYTRGDPVNRIDPSGLDDCDPDEPDCRFPGDDDDDDDDDVPQLTCAFGGAIAGPAQWANSTNGYGYYDPVGFLFTAGGGTGVYTWSDTQLVNRGGTVTSVSKNAE